MRPLAVVILSLGVLTEGFARLEESICGTHPDRLQEELHLHRRISSRRGKRLAIAPRIAAALGDTGEIAILDDSDGVVARRNAFNPDGRTIQFSPLDTAATRYRFLTGDPSYDAAAASAGDPL